MERKIDRRQLAKKFLLVMVCIVTGFSIVGISNEAFAYQEIDGVRVIDFGCLSERTCTLTIDRDHPVTPDGTASCVRRVFAWNRYDEPGIFDQVREAYNGGSLVKLRYSEYSCYDARGEGGDQYMHLTGIWLQ